MATVCTHPLDLLKVRLQTSSSRESLVKIAHTIIRTESVFALFNGLSASLLRQLTYSTARFGGYDILKNKLTSGGREPPLWCPDGRYSSQPARSAQPEHRGNTFRKVT